MLDPDQVRARATKFENELRRRNGREYVASAVVVVGCAAVAVIATGTVMTRIACAAGVVSAIYVSARMRNAGWRARPSDEEASDEARLLALKDALVRQRDLLASAWRWYVGPFAITVSLFLLGAAFELVTPPRVVLVFAATCAAACVAIGWMNRAAAAKLQRELDAL